MSKQNANYFSFLLRAWRDHEGAPWRFSLEGAHTGEQLRFTELEGLVDFLQNQMGVETVAHRNPCGRAVKSTRRARRTSNRSAQCSPPAAPPAAELIMSNGMLPASLRLGV